MRVVGHVDAPRDLRLRQGPGRGASDVDDGALALDLLPLERLLRSIRIEALAILSRGREEAARHFGADVRVAELERRGFDRERAAVLRDQAVVDAAGAVADHMFGVFADERQARADA